ncbi:HAD family hydrolase [Sphaerisporangium rubeum]|uniref:HAD superfamily hydrolase (TIGR01509 family) n=2 Tax=Sphaerisporangium rubeum TaxID=321317 RepID=A0A7X0M6N6_9ACTN|nr:HAD-IA family hydrolase [Sphaerisporangium rubeum]MBB6473913.1 HAD superfamily hydrolase (TIGR01509 family) [Sphaerisporangium rubeum]
MPVIDLAQISAVVFDTDGVVTDTARVHAAAWKRVFDTFLRGGPGPFEPFDVRRDYLAHVDGRPRPDAVRAFLSSRGLALPEGRPGDAAGSPTVHGLARAEEQLFLEQSGRHGVAAFPDTVALLRDLRRRGCRTAVVSGSGNSRAVVAAAGVLHLFDTLVDGEDAARLGLACLPDPALLLEAVRRLDVPPKAAALVEDSAPGVTAGRLGGFGLVVGVDHGGRAAHLAGAGAGVVVTGLGELTVTGRVRVGAR